MPKDPTEELLAASGVFGKGLGSSLVANKKNKVSLGRQLPLLESPEGGGGGRGLGWDLGQWQAGDWCVSGPVLPCWEHAAWESQGELLGAANGSARSS